VVLLPVVVKMVVVWCGRGSVDSTDVIMLVVAMMLLVVAIAMLLQCDLHLK